jgi:hypothetical protein
MKPPVLAALLCALAVAGCGGDDGGGGGGGSGPSESAWRSGVTKVCQEIQTDSQQVLKDVQEEGLGERETAAEVIERSIPILQKRLDEMKAIETPAGLQKGYDAFVSKLAETVELFPRIADAVRANRDDPELTRRFQAVADDTRPFAAEHGLKECLTDQG